MKRIAVVLMMALLIAGCQGKKKQVFTEEDLEEQIGIKPDVDWIGLYVRAHELDSLKNIAEVTAARNGSPMPALPDSVKALWDEMGAMMLLRNGEKAFDIYDTHREDIENYLRLDFLNYGFITKVYLPYKATISTREEYGEICIAELEKEFAKVQQQLMAGLPIPSHYDNLLIDLYQAYVNYDRMPEADAMCNEIFAYYKATGAEGTRKYADMLARKAELCYKTGSTYTMVTSAKQAIKIYEDELSSGTLSEDEAQSVTEAIKKLEDNLKSWQKK